MGVLGTIRHLGMLGTARKALLLAQRKSGYTNWRFRNTPKYANPTQPELEAIESDLARLGVSVLDYAPSTTAFESFKAEGWFPADYHGGPQSGAWDEKLLEHWIASERLGLMDYGSDDVYVDVAAASSPWAQHLRERKGLAAFAIDLEEPGPAFRHLSFYRREDATHTAFADSSVRGISLHCAYEMFMGDDDTRFLHEASRILAPGGKVVILPLYMHTHHCAYSTPEYFGKGYSDHAAKEYIRLDCLGVPSSRKYDVITLKKRVLDPLESLGMSFRVLALRNKQALGNNIYCHFILEIER